MLAAIAAVSALIPLAASSAAAAPSAPAGLKTPSIASQALTSTAPWWEKMVVRMNDEGDPRDCRYETSLAPGSTQDCKVNGENAEAGGALPEQITHITFERRFSPGANLDDSEVGAGNTLIGRSVMALALDETGRVRGCKVVASGGSKPDYGCKEAAAEKFEASVREEGRPLRVVTFTILVYAHDESYV